MQREDAPPPFASYLGAIAASVAASVGAGVPSQGAPQGAAPAMPQGVETASLVKASIMPALVRAPGGGEALSIAITIAPHWHIYWSNPGDSGAAPSVKLELPAGWTAGALTFPRPEIFGDDDERTFGYSGTVHLLVPVTRPEGWQGPIEVRGELSWLACKRSCVAGRSRLEGSLPSDPSSRTDAPAGRTWPAAMPAGASASVTGDGTSRTFAVAVPQMHLPESARVQFIAEDCAGIRWGGGTGPFGLNWDGQRRIWTLQTPVSVTSGDAPGGAPRVRGLLVVGHEPSAPAFFVDIPVPTPPTLSSPEPAR